MTEQPVDEDAVRHVADLARIDLTDEEATAYAGQFAEILSYFDTLEEVPETDVEPDLVNVLRPDEREESLDPEDALANAPETEDGKFKGPRVS
ncbi:MAG: Asp-tRNA(Asn)/Glu-tRNA(Gln) amidotransferase subunit GatC [Halobacteriaceae archaeon]